MKFLQFIFFFVCRTPNKRNPFSKSTAINHLKLPQSRWKLLSLDGFEIMNTSRATNVTVHWRNSSRRHESCWCPVQSLRRSPDVRNHFAILHRMIDYSGLDFESPLCRIPFRKRKGIRASNPWQILIHLVNHILYFTIVI